MTKVTIRYFKMTAEYFQSSSNMTSIKPFFTLKHCIKNLLYDGRPASTSVTYNTVSSGRSNNNKSLNECCFFARFCIQRIIFVHVVQFLNGRIKLDYVCVFIKFMYRQTKNCEFVTFCNHDEVNWGKGTKNYVHKF